MNGLRRFFSSVMLGGSLIGVGLAAAPAPPSYLAVERVMGRIESNWLAQGIASHPNVVGWSELFQKMRADLRAYATSESADDRVAALGRLHKTSEALTPFVWSDAVELREELRHWLRPRVALSWAEYRVLEGSKHDAGAKEAWSRVIETELRPAVRALEAARTSSARLSAMERVREAMKSLRERHDQQPSPGSETLKAAVDDLYDAPNLEVTLDSTAVVGAIMPQGIVEPGPVFFRGQWSYVTPGPVTGVGFVPTPDGIQVAISQRFTSTTPVRGFHEQIAADPQGQRAAKMYHFTATTRNDAVLTMVILFRLATGLHLNPNYQHSVDASICTTPARGGGLQRLIGSLIGYGQQRITNEVYSNAIGRMRSEVVDGAQELSAIRTGRQQAILNEQIGPYIADGQSVRTDRVGVTDLKVETLPDHARAQGRVIGSDPEPAAGAAMPQPRRFSNREPGITADIHLPSALATLLRSYLNSESAKDVQNVVVEAPAAVVAGSAERAPLRTNVDYATFLSLLVPASEGGGSKIRVHRPSREPEFTADATGNLVVMVPGFQLDLPAPEMAARGGGVFGPPARVYRIKSELAEFSIRLSLEPSQAGIAPRLSLRVVDFDPGPKFELMALPEDEAQAVDLNPVAARVVLQLFKTRLAANAFEVPVDLLNRPDLTLQSVSELDPTGWVRLVLLPL